MKKYVNVAAKYQGLTKNTHVTGLADGAKNCWGIIKSLEKDCQQLTCILDWFHISKKFQPIITSSAKSISDCLVKIKNNLWRGKVDEALEQLKDIKAKAGDDFKNKINNVYIYIKGNQPYITDYSSRAKNQLPYTSQVAESTVEHLINDRQKRNQKMQWSREGAHNVLQIRAAIASKQWDLEWQDAIFEAIKRAA